MKFSLGTYYLVLDIILLEEVKRKVPYHGEQIGTAEYDETQQCGTHGLRYDFNDK
ncbi:uncharacterized protein PHALS_03587 [Plasmopara halstedii]|uniref:Uncharacterized protein n=1 Tax=Plasmopara halstedii TaxID=4781 RepID=A0A0P1AYK4_PLAHL|nr:uncharacterized protein PHALS_03587 [Plasmopara halstedii]CEG46917.1 hypothetical protein PHALS_03587 [Plasmopara halstedii]|eukprot:XP_024583286.1 hypothetical protein PHALS_03587 [Plasmopara halstedii]